MAFLQNGWLQCQASRPSRLWSGLAALSLALPAHADVAAQGGGRSLGTLINGERAGRCAAGLCVIGGGTKAGDNLFHRLSSFDTRGAITGVRFLNQRGQTVIVGVSNPWGSWIDKTIQFQHPGDLLLLSPGGIRLGAGAGFLQINQLGLSTATQLAMQGGGAFDVLSTTAFEAASLAGAPLLNAKGLKTEASAREAAGITSVPAIVAEGVEVSVDQSLLIDGMDGLVQVRDSSLSVQPNQGMGGTITLTGRSVEISGTSQLKAQGPSAGGQVLIGGGQRGDDENIRNAREVRLESSTQVLADATGKGNGGRVIVWSNERTDVHGSISAQGGAEGGDGGFVETSSAKVLNVSGRVSTAAPKGSAGQWLLDPEEVTITADGETVAPTDAGADQESSNISAESLQQAVNEGAAVTVEAQNGVTGADQVQDSEASGGSLNTVVQQPVAANPTSETTPTSGQEQSEAQEEDEEGAPNQPTEATTASPTAVAAEHTTTAKLFLDGVDLTLNWESAKAYTGQNLIIEACSTGCQFGGAGNVVLEGISGLSSLEILAPTRIELRGDLSVAQRLVFLGDLFLAGPSVTLAASALEIAKPIQLASNLNGTASLQITTSQAGQAIQVGGNAERSWSAAAPLVLQGDTLTNISQAPVAQLTIGGLGHTGGISVGGSLSSPNQLQLKTSGNVSVEASGSLQAAHRIGVEGTEVLVAGNLTVSDGLKGGEITVVGDRVTVTDSARIAAKGENGGGLIQLGGSWQNSNPSVRQALQTTIHAGAQIEASATLRGDGGTIVAWSDVQNPNAYTKAYGTFLATGGSLGGRGGEIETSGYGLDVAGIRIQGSGLDGTGQWLLDPSDITIQNTTPTTTGSGTNPKVFSTTGSSAIVNTSDIIAALQGTQGTQGVDVVVDTSAGTGGSGDITLASSLSYLSTTKLTLKADRNIVLNASLSQSGTGNVDLLAGQGASIGEIRGQGNISLAGGILTVETDATGTVTDYSGSISGNGGRLVKNGIGIFSLSGTNTYTGTTTINSGTLRLASGGSVADTSNFTVNSGGQFSLTKSAAETIGSIAGTGSIYLATTNDALGVNVGSSSVFSGVISGMGQLTKLGSGTLVLTGNNTYSGGTTISAGSIALDDDAPHPNATTYPYVLNRYGAASSGLGTGTVVVSAGAELNLTGRTLGNNVTLAGGGNNQIGGSIRNGRYLNPYDYDGSYEGGLTGTLSLLPGGLGGRINTEYFVNISGKVTDYGQLYKVGNGFVTLSNISNTPNDYLGGTVVESGVLRLASSTALGNGSSTVMVKSGGVLDLWGQAVAGQNPLLLSGSGINQSGALVNSDTDTATYPGLLTLGDSTLITGETGGIWLSNTGSITGNGYTLSLGGAVGGEISGTIATGSGGLTKGGSGTWILSGNNTYTGGTTLAGGTLQLGSAGAIGSTGTITFSGGTLRYSSANSNDYSSRFSTSSYPTYQIDTNGQNVTFASALTSQYAGLTKSGLGTLTLTANNTYTGNTVVTGGTLTVLGNGPTSATCSGGASNLCAPTYTNNDYSYNYSDNTQPPTDSGNGSQTGTDESGGETGPESTDGFEDFQNVFDNPDEFEDFTTFFDDPETVASIDDLENFIEAFDNFEEFGTYFGEASNVERFGELTQGLDGNRQELTALLQAFEDFDSFETFFDNSREVGDFADLAENFGGIENFVDFFGNPEELGGFDQLSASVDAYQGYLGMASEFGSFEELVTFANSAEEFISVDSAGTAVDESTQLSISDDGLSVSGSMDDATSSWSSSSQNSDAPTADNVASLEDAESFASYFGETSVQYEGLSVDISLGSSFFADTQSQGNVPNTPAGTTNTNSADTPQAAGSQAESGDGAQPSSNSGGSQTEGQAGRPVTTIPAEQAVQEATKAEINQAEKALESLVPEASKSTINTPSPQQIQQSLQNATEQIRRGNLDGLRSQAMTNDVVAWSSDMGLIASLTNSAVQSDAGPSPILPPSFNRARYTPAVLHIRFTEDPSSTASRDTFLDLTLVPIQGEAEGRRVDLSKQEFATDLKQLYRQLSRQESLDVTNPTSASRRLYNTIFGAIQPVLEQKGITTLLISADRGLQAIPFAALHDGRRYFGEAYAFSLTPSLALTSLEPPVRQQGKLLAAGSAVFDGLAPLPLVPQELNKVGIAGRKDEELNKAFTPRTLMVQAGDHQYSRVHIATHAEFLPGGPASSRLFSGTVPVPLSDFVKLRRDREGAPLDLISFSACRTALGDAETELGFAGLALQAGARSAVGTLWYVDDVATSAYFVQMYRYLDSGVPKAEALQLTRQAFSRGLVHLEGDKVTGPDGQILIGNLTQTQQRRAQSGFSNPYFWAGIELLGAAW